MNESQQEMVTYFLMIKTHNKTGLKYLCQTSGKDPINYRGSGKDWRPHLREHGVDITTEILYAGPNRKEMTTLGRYYSNLWRVVTAMDDFGNKIWANRIPETGGGAGGSTETNKKISIKLTGVKKPLRTDEHRKNLGLSHRGIKKPGVAKFMKGRVLDQSIRDKQSDSLKEWYEANPDKASDKAMNTWKSRYKKDYSKYKSILELLANDNTMTSIRNTTGADWQTIKKLKDGVHTIFNVFPELKNI